MAEACPWSQQSKLKPKQVIAKVLQRRGFKNRKGVKAGKQTIVPFVCFAGARGMPLPWGRP
jgi:hypothetical protein